MRRYISTIHTRSDAHKKRFALGVSGLVTLMIFGVWSVFTFDMFKGSVIAEIEGNQNTASAIEPLENVSNGLGESFKVLKDQFNTMKGSIKSVDFDSEYEKIRSEALNQSTSGTAESGTVQGTISTSTER